MVVLDEDVLAHYGVIRRSGRYPWGSGGNVDGPITVTNNKGFLDWIKGLRFAGFSDKDIYEGLNMSSTDFRAQITISTDALRQENIASAVALKDRSWSNTAIAKRLGVSEGTVRNYLAPSEERKESQIQLTAKLLRQQIDEKGVIDVGKGVSNTINVSDNTLKTAVAILKKEGYTVGTVKAPQQGTDTDTTVKFIAKPGTTQKEVWQNQDRIRLIDEWVSDDGTSVLGIKPPLNFDSKRLAINYAEDGGAQSDGLMYIRPGVEDLSLGGKMYAQVRVQVDGTHYLKGMAVYKDDLPDGVDILFNTNKTKDVPVLGSKDNTILKPLKTKEGTNEIDTDNPFGTVIKNGGQILRDPSDRSSDVTSVMNLVYEEGDWSDWSRTLASQVLSKQEPKIAKSQLEATLKRRQEEFDEIMSLTNPTVRKKLLKEFADEADAASVHLKTAGFERQNWNVILPVNSIKPNEIYAPNFIDGEPVVLIRYPHGGQFEIPELRVNNSNAEAKSIMGNARDAVGIHHSVAERLSGADFDGDTVLVIPNRDGALKSKPALEGLKNFDPKTRYPKYPGMKVMTNTQNEMGKISNLITDMTIKEAPLEEIVRAVRHSMVVIDGEKHELNYRESARREGISDLKAKYQQGGASTIISRAKSRVYVDDRKERPASQGGPIDPITGEKVYVPTGKLNYKTGAPQQRRSQALKETKDPRSLSSGTPIENLYADYSSNMKTMANKARLAYLATPRLKYNKTAKETYSKEVGELNAALELAIQNAPRERRAQILARTIVSAKRQENPSADDATIKKWKGQALTEARARTGAGKTRIELTPNQWDAIQAGAISDSKLGDILNNSNMDTVRDLATPRTKLSMTPAKTTQAAGLLAAGYTRAEVARKMGVSLSTLDRAVNA